MTEPTDRSTNERHAEDPDLDALLAGAFARAAEAIRRSVLDEILPRLSAVEQKVEQIDEAIWAPEDAGAAES